MAPQPEQLRRSRVTRLRQDAETSIVLAVLADVFDTNDAFLDELRELWIQRMHLIASYPDAKTADRGHDVLRQIYQNTAEYVYKIEHAAHSSQIEGVNDAVIERLVNAMNVGNMMFGANEMADRGEQAILQSALKVEPQMLNDFAAFCRAEGVMMSALTEAALACASARSRKQRGAGR